MAMEGVYPSKSSLAYTLRPNKYRIPNDYIVETTWGRSKNQFSSAKSAINAANLFHEKYTFYEGTKTSGIYLFGLHLKTLDTRTTNIGKQMLIEFNEKAPKLYNSEDIPVLESISYSVKKHTFDVNYRDGDRAKKKQKNESMIRVLDERNISRDTYRYLCAIEFNLPREGAIAKER
ncbi:hypothetical protein GLOIN_2v1767017 [Rhizophagus irregularis DAOM 181602=DAOM 197198]|uniref:Uncharacterized protein n=1 Tax=Rhizophagus irregularis (strain DAOM 181602 / DAOM 197198 / MUCL 43194) TaxID=747089 RepID=A0A2P4QKU0_RHIID|nr:hypothetical protein GLOIN_2v1767017 [Rhizophagus irregularis DAOM 181602=DAOM 197198]POG78257.1 hypothetical protein GLOIN_2v1767017 [Rhizophagus irregularis DAOM 181602=DAOM 197198]|eukprot:XP_025185123.1 hypothetical protein GLOIN_2v1767017 [Rhizophagus irregularis DAOM 181602=DAOM 197198]